MTLVADLHTMRSDLTRLIVDVDNVIAVLEPSLISKVIPKKNLDWQNKLGKMLKKVKIQPSITKKCGIDIKKNPVFKRVAEAAVSAVPRFKGWEPKHGNQYDKVCGTERVLSEGGKTFVYRKIVNKNQKINRKIYSGLKLTTDGKMSYHTRKNPLTSPLFRRWNRPPESFSV